MAAAAPAKAVVSSSSSAASSAAAPTAVASSPAKAAAAPAKAAPQWIPRQRDYGLEVDQYTQKRVAARAHPLLSKELLRAAVGAEKKAATIGATATGATSDTKTDDSKTDSKDAFDPLRAIRAAPLDPLRALAGGSTSSSAVSPISPRASDSSSSSSSTTNGDIGTREVKEVKEAKKRRPGEFEAWKDKRGRVLSRYTTSKTMAVSANFLDDDVKEAAAPKSIENQSKSRLEQLAADAGQTDAAKSIMTQKEYIAHIEEQHERLKTAWDSGERVVSLKIAIQCAKLLGDTTVPQFYPSMYVLLTDILDTFGDLVFNRIKRKGVSIITASGQTKATSLPADFKQSDVSASAKETCRNWFYKTACIRELMPRLYVDLALIKSYRFLEDGDFGDILQRLSKTIRGIGDPLVATYARCYLAHKANDLVSTLTQPPPQLGWLPITHQQALQEAFDDFMFTFKDLKEKNFAGVVPIDKKQCTLDEYLDLFAPAIEWLVQNVGWHGNEELFYATCQQYKEYCNNSGILLHILGSFKASFVSKNAQVMTNLIRESDESTLTSKAKLYLQLGRALIEVPPPKAQLLPILNDVWKVVTKVTDPDAYMEIAEVFIQYLLMNFSEREVNIFLKDVIKHTKKDGAHLRLQDQLRGMVANIMEHSRDIDRTLAMDNFLPLLDLLERKTKVEAGKIILRKFADGKKGTTADPVIIHTLFDISRSLHDSIDSLSFDDDRRQISLLIVNFIRKIEFGRDLERQLATYVDCRQAFTNLDGVTTELVLRVCLLASRAHRIIKGVHTKKTSSFVKACLAYCHITVPSLDDVFARLRLLLECAEVSLTNQMIVQAEGFLKAAISLIPQVPAYIEVNTKRVSTEEDLVSYLRNFSSFLLLFPGHPDQGPFYLARGFLNSVAAYDTWKVGSQGKIRVYLGVLTLFCTYAQRNFPYHIDRVESNDALYGGDADYLRAVSVFIDTLITQVLATLTEIGEGGDIMARKRQGTLALEFANVVVSNFEMNAGSATLIVKLFQLAKKSDAVDVHFLRNSLEHIQSKKGTWYQEVAAKIIATLSAAAPSLSSSSSTSSGVVSPLSPSASSAAATPTATAAAAAATPTAAVATTPSQPPIITSGASNFFTPTPKRAT